MDSGEEGDRIPSEDEETPKINKINSMQNDAMMRDGSSRKKMLSSKAQSLRDSQNSPKIIEKKQSQRTDTNEYREDNKSELQVDDVSRIETPKKVEQINAEEDTPYTVQTNSD